MCARLVARQFLFFFTPYMKKLYGIHDTVDKRNQLKIRQYLTFKAQTYSKTLQEKAAEDVLFPFLEECKWRYILAQKMSKIHGTLQGVCVRMTAQVEYNETRLQYLLRYWKKEERNYALELRFSTDEVHYGMYKQLVGNNINYGLVSKLIRLYINKCRSHHCFAFIQSRKQLPFSDQDELVSNFTKRKTQFVDEIRKLQKAAKKIPPIEDEFEEPPKATKQQLKEVLQLKKRIFDTKVEILIDVVSRM